MSLPNSFPVGGRVKDSWSGIDSEISIFLDEESKLTDLVSSGLKNINPNLRLVDRPKLATHIVLDAAPRHLKDNLLFQTYLLSSRPNLKVVSFEWIFECARQGTMVSAEGFGLVEEEGSKAEDWRSAKKEPSSKSPGVFKEQDEGASGSKRSRSQSESQSHEASNSEQERGESSKKSKLSIINGNASSSTSTNGISSKAPVQQPTTSSSSSQDKGKGKLVVERPAQSPLVLDALAKLRATPAPPAAVAAQPSTSHGQATGASTTTASSSSNTPFNFNSSSSSSAFAIELKGFKVGERLPGCTSGPFCFWCGSFPPDAKRFGLFKIEKGEDVKGCEGCRAWLDAKEKELGKDSAIRAIGLLAREGERRRSKVLAPVR